MHRFMADDKVSYIGEKFKQDFGGSLGRICAPVQNNPSCYVVDFGNESIVVHESRLTHFQGHLKTSEDDTKKREPKVEKRRGGRNRKDESDDE